MVGRKGTLAVVLVTYKWKIAVRLSICDSPKLEVRSSSPQSQSHNAAFTHVMPASALLLAALLTARGVLGLRYRSFAGALVNDQACPDLALEDQLRRAEVQNVVASLCKDTPRPLTKKLCMACEDLDCLTNFLGFSDDFKVVLLGFLGSRRLWGDSGKVRRGLGSRGKVWERS